MTKIFIMNIGNNYREKLMYLNGVHEVMSKRVDYSYS